MNPRTKPASRRLLARIAVSGSLALCLHAVSLHAEPIDTNLVPQLPFGATVEAEDSGISLYNARPTGMDAYDPARGGTMVAGILSCEELEVLLARSMSGDSGGDVPTIVRNILRERGQSRVGDVSQVPGTEVAPGHYVHCVGSTFDRLAETLIREERAQAPIPEGFTRDQVVSAPVTPTDAKKQNIWQKIVNGLKDIKDSVSSLF